jgi:uncharacterized membrane protein
VAAGAGGADRLVAIDWMRGFVMVLMAIDHGSAVMNGGRLAHDSAWDLSGLGVAANPFPLGAGQFLTRWITHLCAPTFLFLSGTALALSTHRRAQRGESARSIDRHLAVRGLVLLGFEVAWMSLLLSAGLGRYVAMLQVLYAIGVSLVLMAALRRLPNRALVALALGWFAAGEWITLALAPPGGGAAAPLALLLAPLAWAHAAVLYPVLPWLAMMMLGWAFGRYLVARRETGRGLAPAAVCALAGAASLVVFAAVRGWNLYGNMLLVRRDASLVEWLHVSKYPPSLSFASLELGLMALCLAGLFLLQQRVASVSRGNPLLVLGQTALFFYLLHFHAIAVGAALLGRIGQGGAADAYVGALLVVLVLYPACVWYRGYKAAHPDGFAQYV